MLQAISSRPKQALELVTPKTLDDQKGHSMSCSGKSARAWVEMRRLSHRRRETDEYEPVKREKMQARTHFHTT